jgi:hypothetical protein
MRVQLAQLVAMRVSFGSTVVRCLCLLSLFLARLCLTAPSQVDWFVYDVGTNGSGLIAAQNFVDRFNSASDIPIGQHQPPIIAAFITARATTLLAGLPSTSGGVSISLIAGVACGVLVLIIVAVILVVILVRRRQQRDHYEHKQPLLQTRYEPVHSYGAGAAGGRYEPVHSYGGYGAVATGPSSPRGFISGPIGYGGSPAHAEDDIPYYDASTVIPSSSHNSGSGNVSNLRRRSGSDTYCCLLGPVSPSLLWGTGHLLSFALPLCVNFVLFPLPACLELTLFVAGQRIAPRFSSIFTVTFQTHCQCRQGRW